MKAFKFFSALMVLSLLILVSQVNAQKVGIAADKQKQENLEKNKKRQAELKKKYNSLTPEQAAEAKRKANEYKRSGGKMSSGGTSTTATTPKTTKTPAITNKTPEQQKQGTVKKGTTAKKPVFMDEKGKPKVTPVTTQVGKAETKPATPGKQNNVMVKGKPVKQDEVTKKAGAVEKSSVVPVKKK
jgi:hypothetical protein